MVYVRVAIVEWVSDYQPGVVKCLLTDASGKHYFMVHKLPLFTAASLDSRSVYPQPGSCACTILARTRDERNREIVKIDTDEPWGVQSTDGLSAFDVLSEQLEESQMSGGSKKGDG